MEEQSKIESPRIEDGNQGYLRRPGQGSGVTLKEWKLLCMMMRVRLPVLGCESVCASLSGFVKDVGMSVSLGEEWVL